MSKVWLFEEIFKYFSRQMSCFHFATPNCECFQTTALLDDSGHLQMCVTGSVIMFDSVKRQKTSVSHQTTAAPASSPKPSPLGSHVSLLSWSRAARVKNVQEELTSEADAQQEHKQQLSSVTVGFNISRAAARSRSWCSGVCRRVCSEVNFSSEWQWCEGSGSVQTSQWRWVSREFCDRPVAQEQNRLGEIRTTAEQCCSFFRPSACQELCSNLTIIFLLIEQLLFLLPLKQSKGRRQKHRCSKQNHLYEPVVLLIRKYQSRLNGQKLLNESIWWIFPAHSDEHTSWSHCCMSFWPNSTGVVLFPSSSRLSLCHTQCLQPVT